MVEGPNGPSIAWTLRAYRPEQLSGDAIAGLTVAALTVPLSIGYAEVAGLPPEVGLYASIAPLIAYAIFGSGRRLVVGPDASTAALIAASIGPLAVASDERVRLASALGLLVAAIFVGMRVARMGFLADFLSRPVLVGYMTGVGLSVAFGQLEKIAGGPVIAAGLGVLSGIDWLCRIQPPMSRRSPSPSAGRARTCPRCFSGRASSRSCWPAGASCRASPWRCRR